MFSLFWTKITAGEIPDFASLPLRVNTKEATVFAAAIPTRPFGHESRRNSEKNAEQTAYFGNIQSDGGSPKRSRLADSCMTGSSAKSKSGMALASAEMCSTRPITEAEQEVLRLFDALRDRLFRYLTSFMLPEPDAEEIIQETFLALFQHLQRGGPRDNLRGWLFRVAHNLGLKRRYGDRRDYQNFGPVQTIEDLVPDPGLNPEEQLAASQTSASLMAVVRALPELDRQCLTLRAEGLRYREIARVLDVSLSSVSVSLVRSLARISRAAER